MYFFVPKTFRIVVFSWKNRTLNRKKHFFAQKSIKKHFLNILAKKKAMMIKKKHKKAHVLFKSTPYKACQNYTLRSWQNKQTSKFEYFCI